MLARQLIIAILMLLSLSAQASTAVLDCGRGFAAPDCCDPHRQTHGCPAPEHACRSCEQVYSTDTAAGPLTTLERELHTPTFDPVDPSTVPAIHFYHWAAVILDPTARVQRPVERAANRYLSNPTYLATARLRL